AERLRSLGEIATGIAHEINQPLTIINLLTGNIADNCDEEHYEILKKFLDRIEEQTAQMSTIIKNMQYFARTPLNNIRPADIRVPVSSALTFFNELFRLHTIDFTVSFPDDPPGVIIIPEYFQQVVTNLLSNAYHAMEKKSEKAGTDYEKKVDIRLFRDQIHNREKEVLVFELQDNGTGMEKETRDRCLDPFYTTKDIGEGTGLGLYIISRILKEYKMTMEIDS
ncbi:MAG: GHKL domain-containing protein, partial [Desulfobacterales bacterium]|nr:GHKL domain-containing protein [Desulfobacterales bacterium]